jgi:PAS domain S-box-containing protein
LLAESWQIALLVAGTTVCLILSRFTWSFRSESEPAARYFSLYMGVVALRSFWYLLALTAADDASALTWMRIRFLFAAITAVLWLWFVLALLRSPVLHSRRLIAVLLIVPLVSTALAWTNDQHGLIWTTDTSQDPMLAMLHWQPTRFQPLGMLFSAYSIVLYALSLLLLIRAAGKTGGLQLARLQVVIVSALPLLAANLINYSSSTTFNLNTIAFPINGVILGYGILRLHLLGIVPLARGIYLQNALDAVIVTDGRGRIIDVNPTACALVQKDATQLVGQKFSQEFRQIPDHVLNANSSERTKSKLELAWEVQPAAVNQADKRYFDVYTYPLQGRNEKTEALVINLRDITAQRQIELQLRQQNDDLRRMNEELTLAWRLAEEADKAKGQFLSTISHELRTPLHIILGFTELLQQDGAKTSTKSTAEADAPLSARQRDFLERMLSSGKHLLTMINGLLDLSNLQRGDFMLENQPFDVKAWFQHLAAEGQQLAAAKGLTFESQLDPHLPAVIIGDQGRLTEITRHLLSNAVKFTASGSIRLEARQVMPGTWIVQVIDTGIGIVAGEQDLIFQTFRQIDGSSARRFGGMGIGLALARRLALLMGGQITVQSKENQGSTFTLIVPLIAAPSSAQQQEAIEIRSQVERG